MQPNPKTSTPQNIARIILGSLMILAAIGHFSFKRAEFQAQVPDWIPFFSKDFVVVASGVVELLFGLAMVFLNRYKVYVGLVLAIFYVLIIPGNIHQYVNRIDAFTLNTDTARLIRLFFQPVLVLWALWSTGALGELIDWAKKRQS
ncbi:MAG TPA: hypothetical protein VK154_11775 [Chitinophagales bacterium]|nr:hypothetical protein [Chitinophagales bacterium]